MSRAREVRSILQEMQNNDAAMTAKLEAGEATVVQMRNSIDRTEGFLNALKKQRDQGRVLIERLRAIEDLETE